MYARDTLEQLLAAYTNPESHNTQRHRQTDGQQAAVNSRSYCVAVRLAKNDLLNERKCLFLFGLLRLYNYVELSEIFLDNFRKGYIFVVLFSYTSISYCAFQYGTLYRSILW